jgi:hypothetical protein
VVVNFGGAELGILFIIFGLFGIVPIALGIWVAVDASSFPDWAFERAGTSKTLWIVLPLVGVVACGVITIVAVLVWFMSYKPRVVAARDSGGPPGPSWAPPPPASW